MSDSADQLQPFRDTDLLSALPDHIDTGMYIVDPERRILYWNAAAVAITGYSAIDVTGRLCHGDLLMHCDAEGVGMCGAACPLAAVIQDGRSRECVIFLRHKQGHRVRVRVRSRAIHNPQGKVVGAIEVFAEEPSAAHLSRHHSGTAHFDQATGLANRPWGELKAKQALETLAQFGTRFGWVQIGLDKSEDLSHQWGHGFIDAAMLVMGRTLERSLRPMDLLVRWDRSEFRALVWCSTSRELLETVRTAVVLVRSSSVAWWGEGMHVRASAGAVMAQPDDSLASLEAGASAGYEASRSAGGNRATVQGLSTTVLSEGDPVQIL